MRVVYWSSVLCVCVRNRTTKARTHAVTLIHIVQFALKQVSYVYMKFCCASFDFFSIFLYKDGKEHKFTKTLLIKWNAFLKELRGFWCCFRIKSPWYCCCSQNNSLLTGCIENKNWQLLVLRIVQWNFWCKTTLTRDQPVFTTTCLLKPSPLYFHIN